MQFLMKYIEKGVLLIDIMRTYKLNDANGSRRSMWCVQLNQLFMMEGIVKAEWVPKYKAPYLIYNFCKNILCIARGMPGVARCKTHISSFSGVDLCVPCRWGSNK